MRERVLALPQGQRLQYREEQRLLGLLRVRERAGRHVLQQLTNHSVEDGEGLLLLAVHRARNAQKGLRGSARGKTTFTKSESTK